MQRPFSIRTNTVRDTRQRFVEEGLDAALERKVRKEPPTPRTLDGAGEARLIALVCGEPPEGRARWTLRLLAGQFVELAIVDGISYETVRRTPKNELKPHTKQYCCIPRHQSGEFVGAMEDVLELYQHPYDPAHPAICMDEPNKQLVGGDAHARPSSPTTAAPHRLRVRATRVPPTLFSSRNHSETGASRSPRSENRIDWAQQIKNLVDVYYPQATKIRLVMDNQLNTHSIGSLYEAFPPEDDRRIADKLEIHYTPTHGSSAPSSTRGERLGESAQRIRRSRRLAIQVL